MNSKIPTLRKRKELESRKRGLSTENLARVLEKASPALARPLQPKNENDVGKLKLRLAQAGFRSEAAPPLFLSMKFAMLIFGLIFGGGAVVLLAHLNGMPIFGHKNLFKCVFIAGAMFYLPELVLDVADQTPQRTDLPGVARCARLDGRLRRGRLGTRSGHAPGVRRDGQVVSRSSLKNSGSVICSCRWDAPEPKCCRNWGSAAVSTTSVRSPRS